MGFQRNQKDLHRRTTDPKRVKADAYRHANDNRHSPEISMLASIDRFGLEAITGRRQFYFYEYNRLIVAENIVNAYRSRAESQNWSDWARKNPELAQLLASAEIME